MHEVRLDCTSFALDPKMALSFSKFDPILHLDFIRGHDGIVAASAQSLTGAAIAILLAAVRPQAVRLLLRDYTLVVKSLST